MTAVQLADGVRRLPLAPLDPLDGVLPQGDDGSPALVGRPS